VKRNKLINHLKSSGCTLIREGGKHSWWGNPILNKRSAVPRHSEIKDILANKMILDKLGDLPDGKPKQHVSKMENNLQPIRKITVKKLANNF
jgi:mRNA interferase HicA